LPNYCHKDLKQGFFLFSGCIEINRGIVLLIFIAIISIILVAGMIYFFERGKTTIENEEWIDFLWTVDNLQTFLIVIFVICVVVGYLVFKYLS